MDLRDLRLFLHLSQSLHFGQTSRECHVSPSTLSRIVQKLEQQVGAPLFERDNRTVRLTRAGGVFRAYAEQSLLQWSQLQQKLHQQSRELQGRLSVFCSVTASYGVIHDLLNAFRRSHPSVSILLHTGDSAQAVQRVLEEREAISIAAQPDRIPEKLQFMPLVESPLVLIGPAQDCPLRQQLQRSIEAGADYPWNELPFISPESGLVRSRTERWFRRKGVQPQVYARVSGNEAIVSMVSLGFGVAVVPRIVVENAPVNRKVSVLAIDPPLSPFIIGLCSLRRRLDNPLVRAFWQTAKAQELFPDQDGLSSGAGRSASFSD